jgi:hypothetical protein
MVVGELLVAMGNAKLVQPPDEPAGTVEQIELILLTAVDIERFSRRRLFLDSIATAVAAPIFRPFIDHLAGVNVTKLIRGTASDRSANPPSPAY